MPITAKCSSCTAQFKVKSELAGRTVKCPKCSQPFKIPAAGKTAQAQQKKPAPAADEYNLAPPTPVTSHNPMLDLLEQAGVEAKPRGPVCDSCGSELSPTAIICVECGYNTETGKQLDSSTASSASELEDGRSDAEKLLARAEQEIDDSPIGSEDQDFGDGADSFVLAMVCVVGALVLTGIGVGTIFVMDAIGDQVNTALISVFGSLAMYLFCAGWITIIGFQAKSIHGIACLFTGGLYAIVFGFMNGKALLIPTLITLFSIVIGAISYAVYINSEGTAELLNGASEVFQIAIMV